MNQESQVPNNDKEVTSEVTNALNRIAFVQNLSEAPPNLRKAAECLAQCNNRSVPQCYDKCMKGEL